MALVFVSARAEAAGKRIGVPEFEGGQEAAVRMKVMQLLQAHGFELVRSRDMQEAMLLTGASLDSDDDLKTLAKELRLSAIVTGEVGPKRAKIVVHDGGEGAILGDALFSGANSRELADQVALTFWKKLGPDVERGQMPAGAKKTRRTSGEAAAENDERAAEEAGAGGERRKAEPTKSTGDSASAEGSESDEAPPVHKLNKRRRFKLEEAPPEETGARALPPGNPWLDFELGVGGLNRSLTFTQTMVPPGSVPLRPQSLGFAPLAIANLVLYPWKAGRVGNFGVQAEIKQALGISTTLPTGASVAAAAHEYAGGVRYRVLFATTDDVFFSLTLGEDAFTFNGPNRSSLATPDTIYHYTRVGTGMRVAISDGVGVSFGGGYRYIDNRGGSQISQGFFPHLTVAGADADVVARYALNETFEVRAGLEWRRYWYAMHSQPGDLVVADGAVDQSFAFTAGIAVLLGVSNAPQAGGGAEAPAATVCRAERSSPGEAARRRGGRRPRQRLRRAEPVKWRYAISWRLLFANSRMKSAPQAPAGVWKPAGRAPCNARDASSTAVQLVSS